MRALLAILFCLLAGFAGAQTGRRVVLLSGVPGWVLRAGGAAANVDMNFATGQYYGCSLASCLSIVRASPKTNLLPSSPSGFAYTIFNANVPAIDSNGLLIEEARTNQLFNSTALVTQTTGSLANGTYTLWVNGIGTATMSAGTATGCGTGVASQGVPVNFTTSGAAGTCTVTVAGTLQGNLELGAFGTSLIVTAGATATRAADNISVSDPALSLLKNGSAGQVFLAMGGTNSTLFPVVISANGGPDLLEVQNSNTGLQFNGATSNVATFGSGTWAGLVKSATSWTAGARALVINNGTEATSATTIYNGAGQTSFKFGSLSGTSRFYDGYISRFAAWSAATSAAGRKALTQ